MELWTEIHEVNDQGEYAPVEVKTQPDVVSGGVFQLRQVTVNKVLHTLYCLLDLKALLCIQWCPSICFYWFMKQ